MEDDTDYHLASQLGGSIQKNHYLASRDGWLLVLKPRRCCCHPLNFYLLNPATGASIPLPPLPPPRIPTPRHERRSSLPPAAEEIRKALISSSPDFTDSSCHVVILFQSTARDPPQLAWCEVGEGGGWELTSLTDWVKLKYRNMGYAAPEDAAYFGGKLYIVDSHHLYIVHNLIAADSGGGGAIAVKIYPFRSPEQEEEDLVCFMKAYFHVAQSYDIGDGGGHNPLLICELIEFDDDRGFNVLKLVTVRNDDDDDDDDDY